MPTERFACLASGAGLMLALVFIGAHRLPGPWEKVAHFVCFALITALLWRGTAGRARCAVLASVILFGALVELHQALLPVGSADLADFITDAAAALAVGLVLFIRGKTLCAESSEP
jgi:VanZ family protein